MHRKTPHQLNYKKGLDVMLSTKRIQELQHLLHDELGLDYDFDRAQSASQAIMRFVLAKERKASQQSRTSSNRSQNDEQRIRNHPDTTGRHSN